jgi:hypothetical protein
MGAIDHDVSLSKLGKGAVRSVLALDPATTAVPAGIESVMPLNNTSGGYPLATGWVGLGATSEDATAYSRGIEEEELSVGQIAGAIDSEVTEVPREITIPVAHISDDVMKIVENGSVTTVAAATGKSAQKKVEFGVFSDLPIYRLALIGMRSQKAGTVTENSSGGAAVRGRFAMLSLYRVQLIADTAEFEFEKGSLWSGEIGFRAFPEPSIADPKKAHGAWFFEDAGTIA